MRAVNASFDITLCSKILFSAQNYNGTITSLEKYLFIFNPYISNYNKVLTLLKRSYFSVVYMLH